MTARIALLLALLCAPLLGGCGSAKQTLVVYSPHGKEMLGDYEKLFETAYPNIDLQPLDMGASDILARLRAEKNRPAASVWWGAPSNLFEEAAAEGLLAPYRPAWADQLDPAHHDAEDRWYATYRSPLAFLFNTRGMRADEAPQTWDDLLDPRWKGRIALRQPLPSGTMRTFLAAMIWRAPNEDAGIAWLKRLHEATAAYVENPGLLYDHLKKNERRISVWLQPDIVLQRDRNGFPFGYVIPPQTPVLTDGIALVAKAPQPELAKLFYDFVTTQEALAQQARDYAKIPARKDMPPEMLPEWMRGLTLDAMAIDWRVFAEKQAAWCARWEREVYNAR